VKDSIGKSRPIAVGVLIGGIAGDRIGIETVYHLCAFLPLAGLLAWFLPRIEEGTAAGRGKPPDEE
jgi:hypothetical protein